eukprot:6456672-Amphidinium_carterae.5
MKSLPRSSRGTTNILFGGGVTFVSYREPRPGSGTAFVTCAVDRSAVLTLQKLLHRYINLSDLVMVQR